MNWKVIWEAIKEPLREIIMAIIPGVLAYVHAIPATWAIILYLVLRGVDSYLHEVWKADPTTGVQKGLTQF